MPSALTAAWIASGRDVRNEVLQFGMQTDTAAYVLLEPVPGGVGRQSGELDLAVGGA